MCSWVVVFRVLTDAYPSLFVIFFRLAAPRFLGYPLSVVFHPENSINGTAMKQLTAYDDDNDALSFQLLSDGGAPVSLTPSGLLYVDTSKGWLDFEVTNAYSLMIGLQEASNAIAGSPLLYAMQGNASGVISVVDVNEAPYVKTLPGAYRLDEESIYPTLATPYVTASGSFIVVYDEDFGNNSALVVTVASSTVQNSSYFEVVNASNGGVCRGNATCVLRVRSGAPRINYDSPDSIRSVNATVLVTDDTGLSGSSGVFNVTINDVNQGECMQLAYPATLATILE